jgi:fumarylpyruvate hydrolase
MPDFVFAPAAPVSVPVTDGRLFPARRIFCVGRNYEAHAREMGGDPTREPPFFFTKPADALVLPRQDTPYPSETASLHHEIELVVAIGAGGTSIQPREALSHVFGYAVGIDLTRRDMQAEAKALRRPWDLSKGFDASAPIGVIAPASAIGHPASGRIALGVNGEIRQEGDLADQIWPVQDIIAILSRVVALAPGDLIMTGTPEGVNAVVKGDLMEGEISGVGTLRTRVV